MSTQIVLSILLLAVFIVQISEGKPQTGADFCLLKNKYPLEPSEKDNLQPPSRQLLKIITYDLLKMSEKYVQGAKDVSAQLLKTDEILNTKSAKVLEFKKNLTKFEEDYAKCDDIDAVFKIAEDYSSTTSFYFEDDEATFDADSKLILGLLRKYKSEELDRDFEKSFDIFADRFVKKFDALKEDLNNEKDEVSEKIKDWVLQFKTLESYDDRIGAVVDFFKLFA